MSRRFLTSMLAGLALTVGLAATPAAASTAADLMPLCSTVGHDCGTVVNTPDARIIGNYYGHDIGQVLNDADIDRILQLSQAKDVQAAASSAVEPARATIWDQIAQCESGGNWASTVGYYEGGLQFAPSTWDAYKPAGYPNHAYQATRDQQILVGERVLAAQGWGAWPVCSRKVGVR